MKDLGTPYRLEMRANSLSSTEEVSHFSTSTARGVFAEEYVCEREPVFYASIEMDPDMPWFERRPNFHAEASCMLIVHITNETMSESPVETLQKALGLHLNSKRGLTSLWQFESHVEFTASKLTMPDNFGILLGITISLCQIESDPRCHSSLLEESVLSWEA